MGSSYVSGSTYVFIPENGTGRYGAYYQHAVGQTGNDSHVWRLGLVKLTKAGYFHKKGPLSSCVPENEI